MTKQYTTDFYLQRQRQTQLSANKVLALLFSKIKPSTVIDFGCATGTWLAECKRQGVSCVLGLDGDWVDQGLLEIDAEEFTVHNLGLVKYVPKCTYDLALCIEVAEHLSENAVEMLIDTITEASNIVLFSAAVCGQGGTGHINEQPQHYWANQFAARDYSCVDLIRPEIWGCESVNVIYKQNMLLYVRKSFYEELGLNANVISEPFDLDRVHPDLFFMRSSYKSVGRRSNIINGFRLLARGLSFKR